VFGIGPATRIYLALGATDMRKGFEGLYGLVRDRLQLEPLSGHVFIFCNKARNRTKVLFWDGSGLWICAKRLQKGRFSWPSEDQEQVRVSRLASATRNWRCSWAGSKWGGLGAKTGIEKSSCRTKKWKKKLVINTEFLLVIRLLERQLPFALRPRSSADRATQKQRAGTTF
jgi:transposase